jgi:hypothetical protein
LWLFLGRKGGTVRKVFIFIIALLISGVLLTRGAKLAQVVSGGSAGRGGNMTGSLLTGQNASNYVVPPGWTLGMAEGFEGTPSGTGGNMSVTTALAHTGTHSITGTINSQTPISWVWSSVVPNTSREVYLSWWEYDAAPGALNEEMVLCGFQPSGSSQSIVVDFFDRYDSTRPTGWNTLLGMPVFESQFTGWANTTHALNGVAITDKLVDFGLGWHQREVHYKANTPVTPYTDGYIEFYIDGVLIENCEGCELNYNADMSGMSVHLGGSYTKFVWRQRAPTQYCGTSGFDSGTPCCEHTLSGSGGYEGQGSGGGWISSCSTSSAGVPVCYHGNDECCENEYARPWVSYQIDCTPNATSGNTGVQPQPPVFNRYFDDVIILYR